MGLRLDQDQLICLSQQMVDDWNFAKYDHFYARRCPCNKVKYIKRV